MKIRDIVRLALAAPLVRFETEPGKVYPEGGERWTFKRLRVFGNEIAAKSWATNGDTVWSLTIGRRKIGVNNSDDRFFVFDVRGGRRSGGLMLVGADAHDDILNRGMALLTIGKLRIVSLNGSPAEMTAEPSVHRRPSPSVN